MKRILTLLLVAFTLSACAQIQNAPPAGSKTYGQTTYIAPDGMLWYGTNPLKYRGVYPKTKVDSLLALIAPFDASLYYTKVASDARFYPLSTNPAGYLTSFTEVDPTVPAYAKSLTAFSVIKTSTDALYPTLTGGGASGTWNINVLGNAETVTNGVYSTGSYANPSWITSLAYSKLTGAPTITGTTNYITKFTSASNIGNSGLYDTGTALGYGTTAPEASFQIAQGDAVLLDRYKGGVPAAAANFLGRVFNGTISSPLPINGGERLALFGARGFDGVNADGASGWIQFSAEGNQTAGNKGTTFDLFLTQEDTGYSPKSIISINADKILLGVTDSVLKPTVAIGYLNGGEISGENTHKFKVVSEGLTPTVSMGNFGGATAGNAGGHWWAARGTESDPAPLLSGDYIWSDGYRGWGNSGLQPSSASWFARAVENFSDTTHGTEIGFQTNATGHDAHLGRTSTFLMQQDGGFYHPYSKVQSYAGGQLGSYRFDYMANAASRSWMIANDYDAFGDLAFIQSTTQTGSTYATKMYITPSGNVQVPTAPTNPTDVVRLTDLSGYELLSNKSTSTSLGTSNTLYPTQGAVKSYVDAVAATIPTNYVNTTGNQTGILGTKSWNGNQTHIAGTNSLWGDFASDFTSIQTGQMQISNPGLGTSIVMSATWLQFSSGSGINGQIIGPVAGSGSQWTLPSSSGTIALTSDVPIAGSFSGVGTATTVFTVTIGATQANTTYKVNVTPTNLLAAAMFYVTNKTTTTFDVTFLTGLTGTVQFDWSLFK